MIPYRSPLANHPHSPEIKPQTVKQRRARQDGKRPGRSKRNGIAKIEEAGGDATKDDGELEPGEEGAFGGEVDFRLDADGDVDS